MPKEIKINDAHTHTFSKIDVPGEDPVDKKGILIGKYSADAKDVGRIGLFCDDKHDSANNSTGLNIKIELDSSKILNFEGTDITNEFKFQNGKQTKQRNEGNVITMTLKELDYCDTNGNQKKILVLASEPYDVES